MKAWDEACPSPHLCVCVSVPIYVCVYMPLGLLCPAFPTNQPSEKNLRGKGNLSLCNLSTNLLFTYLKILAVIKNTIHL